MFAERSVSFGSTIANWGEVMKQAKRGARDG
jgi:hypothetical protein